MVSTSASAAASASTDSGVVLHIVLKGSLNGEVIHEGEWLSPCPVYQLWRQALRKKPGADCRLMLAGEELSLHGRLSATETASSYSIAVIWMQQQGQTFPLGKSFAALKRDGSVVTWGKAQLGGDSSSVANELLSDVEHIYRTIGLGS